MLPGADSLIEVGSAFGGEAVGVFESGEERAPLAPDEPGAGVEPTGCVGRAAALVDVDSDDLVRLVGGGIRPDNLLVPIRALNCFRGMPSSIAEVSSASGSRICTAVKPGSVSWV